jgi:hypothetical protein
MANQYTPLQRALLERTKCSDIGISKRYVDRLLLFDIRTMWDLCEYLDNTEGNRSSWMQEVSVYRDDFLLTLDEHGDTKMPIKARRIDVQAQNITLLSNPDHRRYTIQKQKSNGKAAGYSIHTTYSYEVQIALKQMICADLGLPYLITKYIRSHQIDTVWDLCVYLDQSTTHQTVNIRRLQRIRERYVNVARQQVEASVPVEVSSPQTTESLINVLETLQAQIKHVTLDQRMVLERMQCEDFTVGTLIQTLHILNIYSVWDLMNYLVRSPMATVQWKTTAALQCVILLRSMNTQGAIADTYGSDVVASSDDSVTDNMSDVTLAETLPQFLAVAQEYISQQNEYGSRDWAIFCVRYGLQGHARRILEDIGREHKITRERVRQTEQRIITQLSHMLHGRYLKNVDRSHAATMRNIGLVWRNFLQRWIIVRDIEFQQALQHEEIHCTDTHTRGIIEVIMMLVDAQYKEIIIASQTKSTRVVTPIWILSHSTYTENDLNVIEYVHKYLVIYGTHALSLTEIVDGLNTAHAPYERFTPELVEIGLSLCDSVQKLENGKYEIQLCYLSRTAQAERILSVAGEPMLSTDIVATINAQQPAYARPTTIQNLVNQMTQSELFVPIGKSGKWALTSMNVVTDSVINLMQQALREWNTPASDHEIYQYVFAQRPVSENSIKLYLSSHRDIFIQLPQKLWALKEWRKEGMIDLDMEIPRYIQQYIHSQHHKMINFHAVRDAVAEYFQISKLAATHRIQKLKTVHVEGSGEQKLIWIDGNVSREEKRYHRKNTVENQIHEQLRRILEGQPSHRMLLTDVSRMMFAQNQHSKASVYSYINSAQFIEKYVIKHNAVVCVINEYAHHDFEYIALMIDDEVRAYILKAITVLQQRNAHMCIQMLHRRMQESMVLIAHWLGIPDDGVTAEAKYSEWFTVVKKQEIHVSIYTMQYLLRIYGSDDFTHKYSGEQVLHHLVGLYINVIVELDAFIRHFRQAHLRNE